MKIFKFSLVYLFMMTVISCKPTLPKLTYTLITGKIDNTQGGELTVESLMGYKKNTNVKDDGTFLDTLYLDDGYYTLRYGKSSTGIYLAKGATINFTTDEQNFTAALKFEGDYEALNNYYAERGRIDLKFMNELKDYCEKDEEGFTTLILADRKMLEDKLTSIDQIPDGIEDKEIRHLFYSYLQYKSMYESSYHSEFANKENYIASEDFMKELKELKFDRPEDYQYSSAYNHLVFVHVVKLAIEERKKDSALSFALCTSRAAMQLENEALRNLVLYRNMVTYFAMADDRKELFNDFNKRSTNDAHKKKVNQMYEYLSTLDPGRPSPKFENYENYAGGTTSLSDFKGKYVYIDIWATWCGPCKGEIPFLDKVEKQYHGKNIEFVSISVDDIADRETWREMIEEKQMSGVQLFADKAFNSDFIQAYKIGGIPQFILLDPDLNIVESNAPRPSDDKLITLFNELNI